VIASSVHLSDEEALAQCPRDLKIRALKGNAIVWFLPYRRAEGLLEIPETARPQSVEAIIIHDASEHGLDPGVKVGASRMAGTYFEIDGHRLCTLPGSALVLVDLDFSPEVAA